MNAIKFISFQRNPLNTRNYGSMGPQVCFSINVLSIRPYNKLLTMKTTTKSLNSLNEKLEDKTAKEINFSCSRNQMRSVKTDWQFTKTLRMVNVQENFRKITFKLLTAVKFNRFRRKSINILKYARNGSIGMFVMHLWSIWHHIKSYDYENNNNKNRQKPKVQNKSARRIGRSHLDHKLSLKTLSVIHWKFYLRQYELSILE